MAHRHTFLELPAKSTRAGDRTREKNSTFAHFASEHVRGQIRQEKFINQLLNLALMQPSFQLPHRDTYISNLFLFLLLFQPRPSSLPKPQPSHHILPLTIDLRTTIPSLTATLLLPHLQLLLPLLLPLLLRHRFRYRFLLPFLLHQIDTKLRQQHPMPLFQQQPPQHPQLHPIINKSFNTQSLIQQSPTCLIDIKPLLPPFPLYIFFPSTTTADLGPIKPIT